MNIFQSLKLHHYTYRRYYFLFWFLILLSTSSLCYFLKDKVEYYIYIYSIPLCLSLIFTIINGIYEYNSLYFHYFYLKTNSEDFYFGSLVHAFINGIIQSFGLAAVFGIIVYFVPDASISFLAPLLFTFFLHLATFGLTCFLTILFRNLKYIRIILLASLLIGLVFVSWDYLDSFIYRIQYLYNNLQLLNYLIPILLAVNILVYLILYFGFKALKRKKALSKR